MMERDELLSQLETLLSPHLYKDMALNGLQIEGKRTLKKIAFALSADVHTIERAVESCADALIVHHGLFWKMSGARALTGPLAKRVFPLIKNDINLIAYHLPLDGHLEIGNAATLAKDLKLKNIAPFGFSDGASIGVKGEFETALTSKELSHQLTNYFKRPVVMATPFENALIKTIGIITGGAGSSFSDAVKDRLDAFLTGEISEYHFFDAREAGLTLIAGGHTATETPGILSLKKYLETHFSIETEFFSSDNPV